MDSSSSFNAGEFFIALKNNDADKISDMLRGIDEEELKLLLLSEVENREPNFFTRGYPIKLAYVYDARCLSLILDKLSPSFRLEILRANFASKHPSCHYYPIFMNVLFVICTRAEKSKLEVLGVIRQHLSSEDWRQLVFTTDGDGVTMINYLLRHGDSKEFHGCLKFILDSVDANDRVPLIQLRGVDGRSAVSFITPGPVGLTSLKLLAGCLDNPDLLNLF